MDQIIKSILTHTDRLASRSGIADQLEALKSLLTVMWIQSSVGQIKSALSELLRRDGVWDVERLKSLILAIDSQINEMERAALEAGVQFLEGECGFSWEIELPTGIEHSESFFKHRCDAVQNAYVELKLCPQGADDPQGAIAIPEEHQASSSPILTSVPVKHWDKSESDVPETHNMVIDDRRHITGQVFTEILGMSADEHDLLMVSMEINSNPLNEKQDVPCYHVHFDCNQVAVSLFKVGDQILVRPENDINITPFDGVVKGLKERLFWLSQGKAKIEENPICIAQLESNAFTFTAVGVSELDAKAALQKGLSVHAGQFDLQEDWWVGFNINFLTLNAGGCARDYQVLVGVPNGVKLNKNHH